MRFTGLHYYLGIELRLHCANTSRVSRVFSWRQQPRTWRYYVRRKRVYTYIKMYDSVIIVLIFGWFGFLTWICWCCVHYALGNEVNRISWDPTNCRHARRKDRIMANRVETDFCDFAKERDTRDEKEHKGRRGRSIKGLLFDLRTCYTP